MKTGFVILSFFYCFTVFAQEKSSYYYDELHRKITKTEFYNKLNPKVYLPKVVENDTLVVGMLILRSVYGQLDVERKRAFIKELEKISKTTLDPNQTLVVNFFYDFKSDLNTYFNNKRYLNFFKKEHNRGRFKQFFITRRGYSVISKRTKVYEDSSGLIRKWFFPFSFEGINYLIVYPNGKYYKYYSEFDQSKILKIVSKSKN